MAIGKQPDAAAVDIDADEGGESLFAEINITPLTDVFLVMVVIFMVSALAVQATENVKRAQEQKEKRQKEDEAKLGINLQLPSGQAAEIDTKRPSLVIDIPAEGAIYVGGKQVTEAELEKMLRAAYVRDKQTQVILRADKHVPHGRVYEMMERAKQTGLSRLGIGAGK